MLRANVILTSDAIEFHLSIQVQELTEPGELQSLLGTMNGDCSDLNSFRNSLTH